MSGFTYLQQYAYNVLMAGYSVFLTGEAGTGKTYAINKFVIDQRNRGRNVMICAPTGIAALHIGGVTLHTQFKANITPNIKKALNQHALDALINTDTLIIDEISMARIDLFEFIVLYIFSANSARRKHNRPNIQVVLSGDFLQLPPVITDEDRAVLNIAYKREIGAGFAFESKYWNMLDLHTIILTEIVRQDNIEFVQSLNKIRTGNKVALDYIMSNCSKAQLPDAINLYGLNNKATERNIDEINKLPTDLFTNEAIITGAAKITDTNAEKVLAIKVGARVMSLVNKKEENTEEILYGNGSLGTVVSINEDTVTVEFDNGYIDNVGKYTWKIKQYDVDSNNKIGDFPTLIEKEIGTVAQFPLKLAYAITIHKSQGQTYDNVNINPYAWDCGQLYVALSRVKRIDNLYLTDEINYEYLTISLTVVKFYNEIVSNANKDLDTTVDLTETKPVVYEDNDMNKLIGLLGK